MTDEAASSREMDRLYQTIDDGFHGVHSRLDVINGRVGKAEVERALLEAKVVALEQAFYGTRMRRRRSGESEEEPSDESKELKTARNRERAALGLASAAIGLLLEAMRLVGLKVWHLLTAAH